MNGQRAHAQTQAAAGPAGARATGQRASAAVASVSNQALQQYLRAGAVRAKLHIGGIDDPAEAEADRMADAALRGAAPCSCGGTCDSCRAAAKLRRKPAGAAAPPAPHADAFPGGGGRALEGSARSFFERAYEANFSRVRVHDGARAVANAKALGARAFTAGSDIGFAQGEYDPGSEKGRRLLAHELAHVVQGGTAIRRQTDGKPEPDDDSDGIPGPPSPRPPAMVVPPPPVPEGPTVGTLDGIPLVADEVFMTYQMEQLVARSGSDAPDEFYAHLLADLNAGRAFSREYAADPGGVSGGVPRPEEELDAEAAVATVMRNVMNAINQEEISFIYEFEEAAKANALAMLDKSEKEERAEAFRYGIDLDAGGYCEDDDEYCYSMNEDSPAATGLQAAAKILLARRQELDKAKDELEDAQDDALSDDSMNEEVMDKEQEAQKKFEKVANNYDLTLGYLGQTYPVLKAFGDRDRSSDDLETLSEKKAGPEVASLIGADIAKRLNNIRKVRDNIDDPDKVDIWRLPTLVGLTSAQLAANTDPFHKRLVDEQVDAAKPSMFESIALLLFNLAALALAGPTGGASLVVAAGVNAVVAYEHIKDYQMQSALSGTAFDKAQALSQDEPSFFWLAVEVVGVALDVSVAFKTVSEAVKAVEVAKEAGDAAEVAAKTERLREAARAAGGEELVAKVMAHIGEHPGQEAEVMRALGMTEKEVESLGKAARAAEEELAAGGAAGEVSVGSAKISRAGHIFSCASPCTWMREKYAALLTGGVTLEGDTIPAAKRFLDLEQRAQEAAEAVTLAKTPQELEEAQRAAQTLEKEISEFDQKLAREVRGQLIDATVKGLGQKYAILQDAGLDRAAIERVLAKGSDIGHVKGQLLEELLASRVRKMLGNQAGREALAGARAGGALEFIDGHRITDALGQQLTDGMIVVKEGNHYRIVTVLESKAGAASARGLRYSWKGISAMDAEEIEVLRNEAIEELRGTNKALARTTQAEMMAKYPDEVEKMMQKLTKGEAGQIRKDIERLVPNEGEKTTKLLIDGKPTEVVAGTKSTKTIGAVPSDVSTVRTVERVHAQGLANFEAMNLDINQADLEKLAQSLADELAATPATPTP